MAEPQELIRPPVENLCDPSAMEQGRHSFDPKAEEFHGVEEILSRPILVGYAFGPKVSSFTEIASTVSFFGSVRPAIPFQILLPSWCTLLVY